MRPEVSNSLTPGMCSGRLPTMLKVTVTGHKPGLSHSSVTPVAADPAALTTHTWSKR